MPRELGCESTVNQAFADALHPFAPQEFPLHVTKLPDEAASRWLAMAATVIILALIGHLLLRDFVFERVERGERIRLRFVERVADRQPLRAPSPARTQAPRSATQASVRPPVIGGGEPARNAAQATLNDRVYTSTGVVRVPSQSQIDPMEAPDVAGQPPGMSNPRDLEKARKLLERRNPIEYDRTVFDKDWKSDGTLGDVAAQSLGRGAKKITDFIFGQDIQSPVARPPPEVRYNPSLYEHKSDLGRAETGDAYKAAPIPYEKPPDLKGEASRRIRASLETLQPRMAHCDQQKVRTLMQPVRTHLTELERVEHALANGADPIMAAQMLPRRGESAYDLSRRALWYAENQLKDCLR